MRLRPTPIEGVLAIELDVFEDERGFFARTYCDEELARAGLNMRPRQINLSHNREALTLRGMHFQASPHAESKIVQCVRGRVFDVVVDVRASSPTFRRWFGLELSPEARNMLFVPAGCAHGFLTLEAASDLVYLMGHPFVPEAGRGVRWNDPAFGIDWPARPRVIARRDATYPDFAA
jgi:dTDP-4-dehydrorhamnose 3,5-epimerase